MSDPTQDKPNVPEQGNSDQPSELKAGPAGPGTIETNKDARTWGMLAHLLGIFTWFIGPLIIWMIKKDEHAFVDDQGKEAVNFQITLFIGYTIISGLAAATCGTGAILYPVLYVLQVVFGIIATMKANNGQRYRYPATLRLIK